MLNTIKTQTCVTQSPRSGQFLITAQDSYSQYPTKIKFKSVNCPSSQEIQQATRSVRSPLFWLRISSTFSAVHIMQQCSLSGVSSIQHMLQFSLPTIPYFPGHLLFRPLCPVSQLESSLKSSRFLSCPYSVGSRGVYVSFAAKLGNFLF